MLFLLLPFDSQLLLAKSHFNKVLLKIPFRGDNHYGLHALRACRRSWSPFRCQCAPGLG
jgi:hypothetical protein